MVHGHQFVSTTLHVHIFGGKQVSKECGLGQVTKAGNEGTDIGPYRYKLEASYM